MSDPGLGPPGDPPPLPREPASIPATMQRPVMLGGAFIASLALLVTYVGATAGIMFAVDPRVLSTGDFENFDGDLRLVILAAQVLGLLLPAMLAVLFVEAAGIRLHPPTVAAASLRAHWPIILGIGIAGCAVANGAFEAWVAALDATGWEWVAECRELFAEQYGPLLRADGPWDVLLTVSIITLVPAACEEVAFRRLIQGMIATSWSEAVAVGTTAVLFSAFHADPLGFPSRLFLGVSIGLVFHRTGSLLAAALVHGINNLLSVILGLATGAAENPEALVAAAPAAQVALASVLGAVGFGAWLLALRRLPRRAPGIAA